MDLDRWFLNVFTESCCCGKDLRHRLLDEIWAEAQTATVAQAARARGLPRAAVEAVLLEWDPERGWPKEPVDC